MLHESNQTVCAIVLGTVTTNKKQSDIVKTCTATQAAQKNYRNIEQIQIHGATTNSASITVYLRRQRPAASSLKTKEKKKELHGQQLTSIIFSNETSGRELSALEKNWLILFS